MRSRCPRIQLALFLAVPLLAVAWPSSTASAAPSPTVRVEPPTGTANGSVTITGSGYTSWTGRDGDERNNEHHRLLDQRRFRRDILLHRVGRGHPRDNGHHRVGSATSSYQAVGPGEIATVAGGGTGDGERSTDAALSFPQAAASDAAGDVYYDEDSGSAVRRIDAVTGVITTVAGQTWGPTRGRASAGTVARPRRLS